MQKADSKKTWSITSGAFQRLLEWLDEGKNSNGQIYLEMRTRLVTYFDRKNCLLPDELADETLNRVARRIQEEGKIECESSAKYCYITARFVFMESLRGKDQSSVSLNHILEEKGRQIAAVEPNDETEIREKRLNCLEQCVEKLEASNREIIIRYYFGEERIKIENRRALAESLQITVNALSIRACRIRDKLEICVKKCVG